MTQTTDGMCMRSSGSTAIGKVADEEVISVLILTDKKMLDGWAIDPFTCFDGRDWGQTALYRFGGLRPLSSSDCLVPRVIDSG
jgi:hypothetical protein